MEMEEKKQRKVDRFWGQDKDLFDRRVEKMLMSAEEEISRINENHHKTQSLHDLWDKQQKQRLMMNTHMDQSNKQIERERYIKLITTSTVSSDEVISTIWNNHTGNGSNVFNNGGYNNFSNAPLLEMTNSSLASQDNSFLFNNQFGSSMVSAAPSVTGIHCLLTC